LLASGTVSLINTFFGLLNYLAYEIIQTKSTFNRIPRFVTLTKSRIPDTGVGAVQVRVRTVAGWTWGQLGSDRATLVVVLHELNVAGHNTLDLRKSF
jgi:hypothetical protein